MPNAPRMSGKTLVTQELHTPVASPPIVPTQARVPDF